ncbi:MAG: hypothetical protein SFX72_16310 [Isosphaeraceae bacterium]|nr:hypothetical protein [Isosphaeraceae bacterium]
MRKVLFALLMIAAAFAGGAVVNGPGAGWLQAVGRLIVRGKEFVRVVDPSPVASPNPSSGSAPPSSSPAHELAAAPARAVPAAPLPPLVLNRPSEATPPNDSGNPKEFKPDPGPGPVGPIVAAPGPGAPPAPLPTGAIEIPAPMPAPPSAAVPPEQSPARSIADAAATPPPLGVAEPPKDPALARTESPATPPASASVPPRSPNSWTEMRAKLREAGVARYEIETDLAGRVRFRCLIPLAGRRAVAQMIEAEGDDEFLAADSALKRIRLWRLAEPARSP